MADFYEQCIGIMVFMACLWNGFWWNLVIVAVLELMVLCYIGDAVLILNAIWHVAGMVYGTYGAVIVSMM